MQSTDDEAKRKTSEWTEFIPVDLFTASMISESAFINAKSSNRLPSFKLYILLAALRRFFEDLLPRQRIRTLERDINK